MISTDYEELERECRKRNWSAEQLSALAGALRRITFIAKYYKGNTTPTYIPILDKKYPTSGHGSDMAKKLTKNLQKERTINQ